MLSCPGAGAAEPWLVSPSRGPMAPGWAVLVLVLSALGARGAVPPPEPGQDRGLQWVWGVAGEVQDEPLPPSTRRKRDESEQQPRATAVPSSDDVHSPAPDLLGSVPPPAPGTTTSPQRELAVPTTANPWDETDGPELLPSTTPPPTTNTSLQRELAVPTTADPLDETDAPDLLLSTTPPPTTNAILHRARVAPTTADPLDETDAPDLLLSTTPPPATNTILHRARVAPTTANPLDETDVPDLLPSSPTPLEPGTQAAPQNNVTTIPIQLLSLAEEGTATGSMDSSSSVGPRSATPAAFGSTTTASKEIKKSGASPAPTPSSPWDTTPRGTAGPPWDPSRLMGKCLLAILLLALVAATFMVCTGVLGARLWRRARTARRQLGHTEMVCISSLVPDGEAAANGPRARRLKPLLDGGSEFDGDNLTLSSFLPEHS
ncbi:P-selectin glycoprotein ligand 1 [Phaenicophaeus curvirostris]|uniref:P-selectin glycoprotein ligand 1 n=1 Tax=Phaenicophaeus curvirostris TaxID=33595 RepID=UPI0037F0B946